MPVAEPKLTVPTAQSSIPPDMCSSSLLLLVSLQDQQRNEELARIMGELEITEQPRQSTSKGDDLLAMMDEL